MKVNILETQINFGTDGIRGNAENFPFTEEALTRLGTSIAIWANQKFQQPNALIISDPRISSYRITTTLSKALQSNGINIFNGGVLPTPAVSLLITKRFNFGIMISASHNPYEDNGIKLFDGNNGKLSKNDELLIQKYFSECKPLSTTHTQQSWNDAFSIYKTTIISKFQPNFLKDLRIVLDCANGATSKIAPEIFNSLGAKVIVIANQPNGKNINEDCGTLYPQNLKNAVLNNNADIGFAFDGDGDRVIAINKNGIIKDGDDLLAILIKHPSFCNIKTVVGTIMTNYGFELYLNSQNKSLIRTNVGDKYISTKLEEATALIEAFAKTSTAQNILVAYAPCDTEISISEDFFVVKGKDVIKETLLGKTFWYPIQGFFQNNTVMAEKMQAYVNTLLKSHQTQNAHLLDLYGGVGCFGIINAALFKSVVIVESVKPSIDQAEKNIQENKIANAQAIVLDAAQLKKLTLPKPLFVITDPPRSGMHPKTIEQLNILQPEVLIYVSCNIDQLGKDIPKFKNYQLKSAALFDFFPQTNHAEAVVELVQLKKERMVV